MSKTGSDRTDHRSFETGLSIAEELAQGEGVRPGDSTDGSVRLELEKVDNCFLFVRKIGYLLANETDHGGSVARSCLSGHDHR